MAKASGVTDTIPSNGVIVASFYGEVYDYKNQEFLFDISIHGLDSAGRKYSEIIVEYSDINTTGVKTKTLAQVMGLTGDQADQIAADAVFTVKLRHGESIKFKALPTNATFYASEQASAAYRYAYEVKANEGAALQTASRSNDKENKALSLNANEVVNLSDKDIEYVFTAVSDAVPYVLPESGFDDQRAMIAIILSGMMVWGVLFWFTSRRRTKKQHLDL